jgi:hypothetical protein
MSDYAHNLEWKMTAKELDELERRCLTDWLMTEQGETTLKLIHELRAAARERDALRSVVDESIRDCDAFADTCRMISDDAYMKRELDKAAHWANKTDVVNYCVSLIREALAQHRGEAEKKEGVMSQKENYVWGDNLNDFLGQLSELAVKHRIGVSDEGVLYEMEHDDFDRTFRVTSNGRLEFV